MKIFTLFLFFCLSLQAETIQLNYTGQISNIQNNGDLNGVQDNDFILINYEIDLSSIDQDPQPLSAIFDFTLINITIGNNNLTQDFLQRATITIDANSNIFSLKTFGFDAAFIELTEENVTFSTADINSILLLDQQNGLERTVLRTRDSSTFEISNGNFSVQNTSSIPEPSSITIVILGIISLIFLRSSSIYNKDQPT